MAKKQGKIEAAGAADPEDVNVLAALASAIQQQSADASQRLIMAVGSPAAQPKLAADAQEVVCDKYRLTIDTEWQRFLLEAFDANGVRYILEASGLPPVSAKLALCQLQVSRISNQKFASGWKFQGKLSANDPTHGFIVG